MKMSSFLEKKERKSNFMLKREQKIRFKIKKVSNRARLSVFKSNTHIYAQLIDDKKGSTLASYSSLDKSFKSTEMKKNEIAKKVGSEIAKRIISLGIKDVAFDRGKYKYHGLIKILADAARTEGLNF